MSKVTDRKPPQLWLKLLRSFCREDLIEDVEGDLIELFYDTAATSPQKAKWLFVKEVMKLFRPRMIKDFQIKHTNYMYLNFIKVAYRNALNYKGYTILNLLGLVLGITTSLLIFLWVEDELQKDQFHEDIENIVAVRRNMQQSGGTIITNSSIPHPVAELVRESYPDVAEVCEVSWLIEEVFEKEDEVSLEAGRLVSPIFFEFFSFELIVGNKKNIFENPKSIVLSEKLARKYLTGERNDYTDLIGEVIKMEDGFDASIVGVVKDMEKVSSLQFDWLMTNTVFIKRNNWLNDWGNGAFYTFLKLINPSTKEAVAQRIYGEIEAHTENTSGETLWLQNYGEAYLYDSFDNGQVAGGRINYIRTMQVVAIFILLIACINYMNLTTARASKRAKEIGVRKAMGAFRRGISRQFYVEAFMYSILAVGTAVILAFVLLPFYNILVNKQLSIDLHNQTHLFYLFLLIVFIGLFSGSYPAQYLSRLSLLKAIKNYKGKEKSSFSVRKGLVVLQVGISFILLFGTLVISSQIDYLLTKDTGIDRENIVAIWLEGDLEGRFETYKNELLKIEGVKAVTGASGNPVRYGRSTSSAKWQGQEPDTPYELNIIGVYDDYFQNLGLEIIEGRDFLKGSGADSMNYIVNETAAKIMGFDDPLGKQLSVWGRNSGEIIGVVQDYHTTSLRNNIAPLILMYNPDLVETALISLEENVPNTIAHIEKVSKELNPAYIFEFEFLDETYKKMYDTEVMMGKLSRIFVFISIIIAVLGLLGLSAYSTEKRTKEIGIRKVHGATVSSLLILLSKEYAILVLLAFILAMPLSYWFMADWLTSFAYHFELGPTIFIYSGIVLFTICILTVIVKAYQTSLGNPIKTLRSE